MAALKEGQLAPDFELPSNHGRQIRLAEFRGKQHVVLYFYPKDNTPGCTQEACDFRDSFKRIRSHDVAVIGVSADSPESHEKFAQKYNLPFVLVSDVSKEMIRSYGAWKKKSFMGKSFMGIERSTFIIDKKGEIRKIFSKVKVKGHVQTVLEILESL